MSIDPLKAFVTVSAGRSRLSAAGEFQPQQQSFEKQLKAAATAPAAAPAPTRDVTGLVRSAQLRLLQGLFDLDLEEPEDDLFTHLTTDLSQYAAPAAAGQKLDHSAVLQSDAQPGLLKPVLTGREELEQLIDRVAKHVSLAPELIRSVVSAESNFTADAVSSAGAQGLMQLMPATAQELGVKDSFDPQQNLLGGSRYLKQLLDKYDGNLDQALAAYNWGQGNVDRKGLTQMPQETRDYLAKVKQGLVKQSV